MMNTRRGSGGASPVRIELFRERMREAGVEEIVEETLKLFVHDAPVLLERFASALERGDAADAEASAHRLKSSSLNIGAVELGRLLEDAETAGSAADLERARALLGALGAELDRVLPVVASELAGGT